MRLNVFVVIISQVDLSSITTVYITMPNSGSRYKPKITRQNWIRILCGSLGSIWFAWTVLSWQSKPNVDIDLPILMFFVAIGSLIGFVFGESIYTIFRVLFKSN